MSHFSLDPDLPVPKHVACIMDGNGRWAQARGLSRIQGHQQGAETTINIVEAATRLGIEYTTLYAFSSENWRRPEQEVGALMGLLGSTLKKYLYKLTDNGVRLHVIGRFEGLPAKVQDAFSEAIERTASFSTKSNLVLALNYGSQNEIADAAKRYAQAVRDGKASAEELSWEDFSQYLNTAGMPDVDLLIRTSGEHRLSNFLMMQCAYAEFYFTDTPWPAFTPEEYREAIAAFQRRERRFGMTGAQVCETPLIENHG